MRTLLSIAVLGCAVPVQADTEDIKLRLIGERLLEPRAEYLGTRIGGLSGLDYDPDWDMLVVVSDDPGRYAPARAYLGDIELAEDRIVGIEWEFLQRLVWATGDAMAGRIDPEGLRIMPHGETFGDPTIMVVSESSADDHTGPRIYEVCSGATRMDEWPAPESHMPVRRGFGVKANRAFESIAMVAPETGVVATEEPLQQDGAEFIRFSTYRFTKAMTGPEAQIAYPLGPGPSDVTLGVTGLTDLLGLAGGRLLAVERTFTAGGEFRIDLYIVDPTEATDVLGIDSLAEGAFTPATKTHIASLNDIGETVLNIEGVCFGPTLDDGTRTLLFVSDSDFRPGIPTVFTAVAIEHDGGVLIPADIIPGPRDRAE